MDTGTSRWHDVRVVAVTESTNADVAAAARAGAAEGLVVIAEEQRAGRGRLDRDWSSPARAGLLLSVLFRPDGPPARATLLPLVAGLAVVEAVAQVGGVDARLKWPNDVIVDDRKLAGILMERVEDAVVVGVGVNVSLRADELPTATATSLHLLGGGTDREALAKEVLRALSRWYDVFAVDGGAARVLAAYREVCDTIGRRVSVAVPDGSHVVGVAIAVDGTGRLVVREDDGNERSWSAGDVVHLRAEG